jgi:hypothetical protein
MSSIAIQPTTSAHDGRMDDSAVWESGPGTVFFGSPAELEPYTSAIILGSDNNPLLDTAMLAAECIANYRP